MLKKYISVGMISLALAILLGHNVFAHPHHHHTDHDAEHLHADHEHHCTEEKGSINSMFGHLFSKFLHGEDCEIVFTNCTFNYSVLSQPIKVLAASYELNPHQYVATIHWRIEPPPDPVYIDALRFLPKSLRAPPSIII